MSFIRMPIQLILSLIYLLLRSLSTYPCRI